ncbi:hypothetical protein DL771_001896 [Monosporascus sp. 5C6A]|nr:hypothetical protein DL771_001896 [Monosporascus sp. 5C6A]
MSLANIEPESFSNLKDKVIVVLGTVILAFTLLFRRCSFTVDAATYTELINPSRGATTGIGVAVIRQLTAELSIKATPLKPDIGTRVVWGDVTEPLAPDTRFVRTDAQPYGSVLDLSETALAAHGRAYHAVYSAGESGPGVDGRLFDIVTAFSPLLIGKDLSTRVLDLNLRGALFFTRIPAHYLRESLAAAKGERSVRGREGETDDDGASILLVGSSNSIAGFAGPVSTVPASTGSWSCRHADHIHIPRHLRVARPHVQRARGRLEHHHACVRVAGSKTYEIEKRLEALRAQWLGDNVYRDSVAVQDVLADIARRKSQV